MTCEFPYVRESMPSIYIVGPLRLDCIAYVRSNTVDSHGLWGRQYHKWTIIDFVAENHQSFPNEEVDFKQNGCVRLVKEIYCGSKCQS